MKLPRIENLYTSLLFRHLFTCNRPTSKPKNFDSLTVKNSLNVNKISPKCSKGYDKEYSTKMIYMVLHFIKNFPNKRVQQVILYIKMEELKRK